MKIKARLDEAINKIDRKRRTRKRRRLKYVAVLPAFITMINGVAGFLSIYFSGSRPDLHWEPGIFGFQSISPFTLAAYLIFIAMLADMLDGRIARLTRTTSSFGGQLDSLCDAVSFGIAPSFLMLKLVEHHIPFSALGDQGFLDILLRGVIFSAILYTMCTILRLARFNVENLEDESAHMYFSGIPSPGAAGVIASLIIFHQRIYPVTALESIEYSSLINNITVIGFPIITILTGLLMVSRIRFPHAANLLFGGKKSLPAFIAIFAAILFSIWNIQLVLVVSFCGFALFGFLRWVINAIFPASFSRKDAEKAKNAK